MIAGPEGGTVGIEAESQTGMQKEACQKVGTKCDCALFEAPIKALPLSPAFLVNIVLSQYRYMSPILMCRGRIF